MRRFMQRQSVTRTHVARFVRGIRATMRTGQAEFLNGEVNFYSSAINYQLGFMNGVLILFGERPRHPKWMERTESDLREMKQKEAAHEMPLADSLV